LKTAQKNEENRQLLEAVINYLGQNGVEAHLTVIYEGGGRTLAILLPGVEPKEVLEVERLPHLNPLPGGEEGKRRRGRNTEGGG
jgi:hypothetical protein